MAETLIQNKKARFDYDILEEYSAGIELFGFEVKSLKNKRGSLEGSHVTVRGGEAFLLNAHIPPYQPKNTPKEFDPYRNRRLLLTKKEIAELAGHESQKGLTMVPLEVYNMRGLIKITIAVVRGRKKHDKRHILKERESKRKIERFLKGR